MQKRTVVDQIEIQRDGTINVRLAKEVVDETGEVLSVGWHRTSLPPGHDIDAQMAAINQNLVNELKFPAVELVCIERTKVAATAFWTPDVLAEYRKKRDAGAIVATKAVR